MIFVSIDIETLGSNINAPIIQVGFAIGDTSTGEILGSEEALVTHYNYDNCEPYAMAMNAGILDKISGRVKHDDFTISKDSVAWWLKNRFMAYVPNLGNRSNKVTFAGKNVASFDLPRLSLLNDFNKISYHHRCLDPSILYFEEGDECLPDTKLCMDRAGLSGEVAHTAKEDAIIVAKLIFNRLSKQDGTATGFQSSVIGDRYPAGSIQK